MSYAVGENGRLYFRYPVGAVYEFAPAVGEKFKYKILDCELVGGKEKFTLACEGFAPIVKTADDVDLIFSFLEHEVVAAGERRELPLLPEEVESYFKAKKQELDAANKEANEKLKGTNYFKILNAKYAVQRTLKLAIADGDELSIKSLQARIKDLEADADKVIAENGVDKAVLTKSAACKTCKDTGFVDGAICACAYERENAIKTFCANARLSD